MIVSLFEQERKFHVERNFRRKVIFMMTFCDRVAAVSGDVVDDVVDAFVVDVAVTLAGAVEDYVAAVAVAGAVVHVLAVAFVDDVTAIGVSGAVFSCCCCRCCSYSLCFCSLCVWYCSS